MRANWLQFETRIGTLTGPPGASPTKAATAVPTPSIGFFPLETSSTYTPGVRYVVMLLLRTQCRSGKSSRGAPAAFAVAGDDEVDAGARDGDGGFDLLAGDRADAHPMRARRDAGQPETTGGIAGGPRAQVRQGNPRAGDRFSLRVVDGPAETVELLHGRGPAVVAAHANGPCADLGATLEPGPRLDDDVHRVVDRRLVLASHGVPEVRLALPRPPHGGLDGAARAARPLAEDVVGQPGVREQDREDLREQAVLVLDGFR